MATVWNSADKNASITLSDLNLTAANSSGSTNAASVRGSTSKATGKWYFEGSVVSSPGMWRFGVGTSGVLLNADITASSGAWSISNTSGLAWNNNGSVTGVVSVSGGDVIQVAVDIDAGKIWFGKNNTWANSGDPAAGTGAQFTNVAGNTLYPITCLNDVGSADAVTAKFGTNGTTYTPPSGFSLWNPNEVTWNSSDKSSSITLTNSDLTATNNSGSGSASAVRATRSRSTGKYYCEYQLKILTTSMTVGIGTSAGSLANYPGAESSTYGWVNGTKYHSGSLTSYGTTTAVNDYIMMAVNFDTGKIWWGKNGTWFGDPVAGTGEAYSGISGTFFPMCGIDDVVNTHPACIANFGAVSYNYSIPTGYSNWNGTTGTGVSGTLAVTDTQDVAALGITAQINPATIAVTDTQDTSSQAGTVVLTVTGDLAVTETQDTSSMHMSASADANMAVTDTPDTVAMAGQAVNSHVLVIAACGDGGVITTSEDGITWTLSNSTKTVRLNCIRQSGGGGTWICVGNSGTIISSRDLISWTARTSGTTRNLECVFYGNGVWVATGAFGTILTSSDDGVTWVARTSSTTAALKAVHYHGGLWVTLGDIGGVVRTSNDAVTWSSQTAISTVTAIQELWYSTVLTQWCAVGVSVSGGGNKIYSSTDGISYTVRNTPSATQQPYGLTYGEGSTYWVATCASNDLFTSTNGTSWTARTGIAGTGTLMSAVWDGSQFIIVGQVASGSTPICFTASDPTSTWTQRNTLTGANDLYHVTIGDMATPTPVDVSGYLQATETQDTSSMAMNVDTSSSVVANLAVVEAQDTFAGFSVSTTISGGFTVTEDPDVAAFSEGVAHLTIRITPDSMTKVTVFGAALFDGGELNIYSGSQPLSPDATPTGVLLASITLPDPAFEEGDDGEAVKVGDWDGAATNSGVAGWFRLTGLDGDVVDGTVTTALGSGDMLASTTNFTVGDPIIVTSCTFQFQVLEE